MGFQSTLIPVALSIACCAIAAAPASSPGSSHADKFDRRGDSSWAEKNVRGAMPEPAQEPVRLHAAVTNSKLDHNLGSLQRLYRQAIDAGRTSEAEQILRTVVGVAD